MQLPPAKSKEANAIATPYRALDKKSPPLLDKRGDGKSSRGGRYNFQGRLIIGTEVGKDLRERERFIREQFSNASLNATSMRKPGASKNRAFVGSASSRGGGNIEDSQAPNDYHEAMPKSLSPMDISEKSAIERKVPKKQLSSN